MLSKRSRVCKGPGVAAAALSPFPGCLAPLQPRAPLGLPAAEGVPGHGALAETGGHGSRAAGAWLDEASWSISHGVSHLLAPGRKKRRGGRATRAEGGGGMGPLGGLGQRAAGEQDLGRH